MTVRKAFMFAGLAALAVIVVVTACSRSPSTEDSFAVVDRAVADLDVQSVGQIALDQRYGRTGISSDPPTRRLAVVSTRSRSAVEEVVTDRLAAAGFTQSSPGVWRRGSGNDFVLVLVTILDHEASLPASANPSAVPPGSTGVVLQISAQI
jgi:hypothetical protein